MTDHDHDAREHAAQDHVHDHDDERAHGHVGPELEGHRVHTARRHDTSPPARPRRRPGFLARLFGASG